MNSFVIGIDPGKYGAISLMRNGALLQVLSLEDTRPDHLPRIFSELRDLCGGQQFGTVYIENVHASPQMGVTSAFTFGKGFGALLGAAYAYFTASVILVPPATWQAALGCMSQGDKSKLFEFAKKSYPIEFKNGAFKKDQADSVLIALYGSNVSKWN